MTATQLPRLPPASTAQQHCTTGRRVRSWWLVHVCPHQGHARAGPTGLRLRRGGLLIFGQLASGPSHRTAGGHISTELRINDRIRVPEVRLVGPNGETVGIVPTDQALKLAQEADLDLVEIAPQGKPPVCKLMDYGKFKYENAQKAREARRNQTNVIIKEMKLRPKIDQHDYETKKGHVVRFLKSGDKVKITIMFRGREQHRPELGFRLLQRLAEDVTELGFVESAPKQDGRNMIMVLGPHKKKAEAKVEHAGRQGGAQAAERAAEAPRSTRSARPPAPPARWPRRRSAAAPRTWTPRSRRDDVTARPGPRPVGHRRRASTRDDSRYDVRGEADAEEQDALRCQQALPGDRDRARSAACRRAGSPALRSHPRRPPEAARSTAATPAWSRSTRPTSSAPRRCSVSEPALTRPSQGARRHGTRQAGSERPEEAPDHPRARQRLPRPALAPVPQGQGAGHPLAGLQLQRPPQEQGQLPPPVDPADQRRRPAPRA